MHGQKLNFILSRCGERRYSSFNRNRKCVVFRGLVVKIRERGYEEEILQLYCR
jgi:hypothetical protein